MKNEKSKNESGNESRMDHIRTENEILQMKLQAETGAVFHVDEELPPEIENIFLRQVQSFEEALRNSKKVTLYEMLNQPSYKKESELNDEELDIELNRLLDLLSGKHFIFSLPAQFDARKVYWHITEVMLKREVQDMSLPGMVWYFDYYEEFDTGKEELAEGNRD
jgi:hypothetical protein